MVGRVLVLVAALLVAAIGASLVLLYVREADERAEADAAGEEYWVAAEAIPAGTTVEDALSQDWLKMERVPPGLLRSDSLRAFTEAQAAQTIINDLEPLHQIQGSDIGEAADVDVLDLTTNDENFVQFVIDDPRRVLGLAEDNAMVSVYVTLPATDARPACTQMLVQRLKIARIGGVASGAVDPATGLSVPDTSTNVTFALAASSDLGQRLIQADVEGEFTLVLVGGNAPPPTTPAAPGDKCLTTDQVLAYEVLADEAEPPVTTP